MYREKGRKKTGAEMLAGAGAERGMTGGTARGRERASRPSAQRLLSKGEEILLLFSLYFLEQNECFMVKVI